MALFLDETDVESLLSFGDVYESLRRFFPVRGSGPRRQHGKGENRFARHGAHVPGRRPALLYDKAKRLGVGKEVPLSLKWSPRSNAGHTDL